MRLYTLQNSSYRDYLGQNVRYYYHWGKDEGDKLLLYAAPEGNNILEIEADFLDGSSKGEVLSYYEGNRMKTAKIAPNADIIYNNMWDGKAINADMSDFLSVNGNIKMIDNTGGGTYNVCMISDYSPFVVQGVNAADQRINFKFGEPFIDLSKSNIVHQIIKDGEEIRLTDLRENDLISMMASKNFYSASNEKKSVKIVVSTKLITGYVESVAEKNVWLQFTKNKEQVTEEHMVSPYFVSDNADKITVGLKGDFYFDAVGKIAYYVQSGSTDIRFGYILDTGKNRGLGAAYQMKILTDEGNVEIFDTRPKLILDGEELLRRNWILFWKEQAMLSR
jgi:hypothetical protein